MIRVKNLSFHHNSTKNPVLKDIGFEVERGEVLAVLGPNGSGKTTLFQCLLGIWKASHGDVFVDGASIGNLERMEIARKLSIVPQDHEPPFPYSGFDVVLMGRTPHVGLFSSPSQKDREVAFQAMETMGIEALAQRPYTQISGGERQMVLIARCLAQEAPVMLLDEPTSHLDFRNQIVVLSKVKSIVRERGLCAVMNLHDPNLALFFADRALLLNNGASVACGKPHEVINRENLMALYGMEVEFVSGNGIKMVCPRL
ncbi:MAG: ABC transporter ATP-binding protein [Syntrophobacteraceae bacterium]